MVAYAAYRMPATFEADRAALGALADAVPQWTPSGHTDIGGGTGAAVWAAADIWPDPADGAAPRPVTVLDWAEPALALGRELAARAPSAALRDARWRRARIDAALDVPPTGLVTVSYVLGELTPADRTAVVDAAAGAAEVVAVVEPGTPDGYRRIIEARDRLVAAGFHIAAPCPHSAACPIEEGTDWCHFAARVSRSSLHRQVKGASLAWEDEKFSYVAATRFRPGPATARVVHAAADPQGPGPPRPLPGHRGAEPGDRHQTAGPPLPRRPRHRLGRPLAAARGPRSLTRAGRAPLSPAAPACSTSRCRRP